MPSNNDKPMTPVQLFNYIDELPKDTDGCLDLRVIAKLAREQHALAEAVRQNYAKAVCGRCLESPHNYYEVVAYEEGGKFYHKRLVPDDSRCDEECLASAIHAMSVEELIGGAE